MSKVRKLLHTRYRLNDLDRTVKFYKETLGLIEVRRHKSARGSELAFLKAPESDEFIELCHFPGSGPVQVQPDLTHLAFEVGSLHDFARHLATLGLTYSDGPHFDEQGGGIAFIDAPEGYEVELIQPVNPQQKLVARQFQYQFPGPMLVMGIVNATPDSFSDGGKFMDTSAVVAHALRLVEEGAAILDVGGESTRPGSTPVSQEEELRRVMPVLDQLAGRVRVPISIDTMKPEVARAALAAGASVVNDVAANRNEETMWRLVAETGAGYVCLHMQGTPQTMQLNPVYRDVVREVTDFFFERLKRLNDCGVRREQVIFDPGIGFGKTLEHNLELLGALPVLAGLGRPLLLGVSRKSFMASLSGTGPAGRLPAGLACATLAAEAGVRIIRVHDVGETVQAVRVAEAILAKKRNA